MEKQNEYYVDGIKAIPTHYGVKLILQKSGIPAVTPQANPTGNQQVLQVPYTDVAEVNMSHEHAKVLVIYMHRILRDYEEQEGYKIPLAKSIIEAQKINLEKEW